MRLSKAAENSTLLARIRARLLDERGYTMVIALGVLVVTSLLVASAYTAVNADTPLTQRDLESKRAYYSARAGVNSFLYELNQNPNLWQTCPATKDTSGNLIKVPIAPGSNQMYSYEPVPANGYSACSPSPPPQGDPISTLIDHESGTFRMRFFGYAGTPEVKRGLIVSFRKDTPLDYLWFTIYETLDPNTYPVPANYSDCNTWERAPYNRADKCRDIRFITGDDLNGPTYTQDQYLIDGSPNFGRTGTNDKTESTVESTNEVDVCMYSDCDGANFRGTRAPSAPTISPPPSNDQLLNDATRYGCGAAGCGTPGGPPGVQTGITRIVLDGDMMRITNCQVTCGTEQIVEIDKFPNGTPIIYVKNATSGCDPTYTPYNATYPATGPCGTVYVQGDYTRSVTIAAQTDIIINGELDRSGGAPAPTLGLVANNFVRVMHGIGGRPAGADQGDCGSNTILDGDPAGELDQTLHNLTIDAAILAIRHSFIVDHFDCGTHASVGELTVNGAIAQTFRGTVGTGSPTTGYLKDYNYDDRFEVAQPPYLFNIASSSWRVERETLCVPDGSAPSTKC